MRQTLPTPFFQKEGWEPPPRYTFTEAPLLVYWELTRACDLCCLHCRAESQVEPSPEELTLAEGKALLKEIASFAESSGAPPHLVFTGGDPLKRMDLPELLEETSRLKISFSLTPAATPLCTRSRLKELKEAGASSVALSLDGKCAESHDRMRGVEGSFAHTLRALKEAVSLQLPVQVNTLITEETASELPEIAELLGEIGISRWALFFLIRTGRGKALRELQPVAAERLLRTLFQKVCDGDFPFVVKTTEAPHYRRIGHTLLSKRGLSEEAIRKTPVGRSFGIRDGNGISFVSHRGEVFPSGFLPLSAGSVREAPLTQIYRRSTLFQGLRNVSKLKGKCGECEFRAICGGSRARAYAATGDPLQSDPLCAYIPKA